MELPQVIGDAPNKVIDEFLTKNLNKDEILRIKAVEETVKFFKGKNTTVKDIDLVLKQFHNFYINKNEPDRQ